MSNDQTSDSNKKILGELEALLSFLNEERDAKSDIPVLDDTLDQPSTQPNIKTSSAKKAHAVPPVLDDALPKQTTPSPAANSNTAVKEKVAVKTRAAIKKTAPEKKPARTAKQASQNATKSAPHTAPNKAPSKTPRISAQPVQATTQKPATSKPITPITPEPAAKHAEQPLQTEADVTAQQATNTTSDQPIRESRKPTTNTPSARLNNSPEEPALEDMSLEDIPNLIDAPDDASAAMLAYSQAATNPFLPQTVLDRLSDRSHTGATYTKKKSHTLSDNAKDAVIDNLIEEVMPELEKRLRERLRKLI